MSPSPKAMIGVKDPLDWIRPADGDCEGAVFLTYTFDARFFEEELLATLLPIRSDPQDQFASFTHEGRRGLQKTPVVVMADAGHFRGRRRLPYDLLLADRAQTFHPKLGLVLFRDHARLWIGSGNLTEGGYGGNAELFAFLQLDYSEDAALLHATFDFLRSCGLRGEAWAKFLDVASHLCPERGEGPADPALLVGGQGGSLLQRVLDGIPSTAQVHAVGVLSPFHQEDSAGTGDSVLERVVEGLGDRCDDSLVLDLGLSWEGNPVMAPSEAQDIALADSAGRLFGWTEREEGGPTVTWFQLGAHEGYSYRCRVGPTAGLRSTRELNEALRDGRCWRVEDVVAPAPSTIIRRLDERLDLQIWLHPEVHRRKGRVHRQPLHAKLLSFVTTEDGVERTHLFVGSANASARALLSPRANVECLLHLRLDGHHRLAEICPGLVACQLPEIELAEREFPEPEGNPARWVEDACYDATTELLTVQWIAEGSPPELRLVYPREGAPQTLFEGKPKGSVTTEGFELHPSCSDLAVVIEGTEGRVPIRIENIQDLAVGRLSGSLSLAELILLHSGRFSLEGLESYRETRADTSPDVGVDDSVGLLDLDLQPREFFRAFAGLAQDLADERQSFASFDVLLKGRAGVEAVAAEILDAPGKMRLTREEAWIYGQELARSLEEECRYSDDPLGRKKASVLSDFLDGLHSRLTHHAPRGVSGRALSRFYRRAP